ncbi:hypothetical protein HA402_016009 [Bradysia odoriphaga]|nr:hypothetical protein HA402_016009 [Bradysia odoriphaga]
MATNGGTLHQGLPPTPRINLNCSQCGVMLDTVESLNVHNMHYHSDHINRWGPPPPNGGPTNNKSSSSTASNSPTDSENNNQPKHNIHNIQHSSKSVSPLHNTVSAAADSSDNQPSTTQSSSAAGHEPRLIYGGYGMSNTAPTFQHQLPTGDPHFQPYIQSYDQYYHFHNVEYGMPPPPFLNSQASSQQEYKPVPSNRYHPYINHTLPTHPNSINSSVSPRNVSSSSPTHNSNVMQQQSTTSSPSNQLIPTSQPTPSPSPNQCDKCGHICETASQLGEHYATAHGSAGHNEPNRNSGSNENGEIGSFPYNHYIKEEQPCDILDLDSQKMVYSPNDEHSQQGPLPPMHSLHHLQRPLLWSHEHHGLPYSQDVKPVLFPTTLVPKQEFSSAAIKQEYIHHQPQIGHQQDVKPFASDVSGGQVTSSPSEFPSTTTPQENGAPFRTSFEAATSSLPTNTATGKSSSWKSNEARRPKTYNCTACNKWFTSSGHLKRHYNTTLHKNAVKSSGQPDPATMPISIHHHPARDTNKNNHHHRGSPAQAPQPPAPSEQSGSPEYNSQYTPPLGFQQTQGFQQYGTALAIHSTTGNSPNGQAGPSVLASQPRGLLILLNNTGTQQVLPEEEQQQQTFMQQITQSHTTNSPDPYSITNPITINTSITTTELSPDIRDQEQLDQSYLTITGNSLDGSHEMISPNTPDYSSMLHMVNDQSMISYQTSVPRHETTIRRLMGGVAAYQGDNLSQRYSPDSPDIPDSYQKMCREDPVIPQSASQHRSPSDIASASMASSTTTDSNETATVHRCGPCVKTRNNPNIHQSCPNSS